MNTPTHCSYCKECPMKFITFDCQHNFCVECLQEIYKTCYQEDDPLCMICLLCGTQTYVETNVIDVIKSNLENQMKGTPSINHSFLSPEKKKNKEYQGRQVNSISLDFNPNKKEKEKREYIKCSEIIKTYTSNDGNSFRNEMKKKEIFQEVSNLFDKKKKKKSLKKASKCCKNTNLEPAVWCSDCNNHKCSLCFKVCLESDHQLKELSKHQGEKENHKFEILKETEIALKILIEAKHLCQANIECVEVSYEESKANLEIKYKEIQEKLQEKFNSLLEESDSSKDLILENLNNDCKQIQSYQKCLEENYNTLASTDNSYTEDEREEKFASCANILASLKENSFDEYMRETKNFICTTNTKTLYSHLSDLNTIQFEISSLSGIELKRKFRRSYLSEASTSKPNKSVDFTFRNKFSARRIEASEIIRSKSRSVSRSFIKDFSKRANTESGLEDLSTTIKEKSKHFSDRFISTSENKPVKKARETSSRKGISKLIESLKRQSESFRRKSRCDKLSSKENNQFLF